MACAHVCPPVKLNYSVVHFRGPRGDKQCAIQESIPQSVCPNDNRILLEGGRQTCDIVLRNVQPQDYGDWTCFVSDGVEFNNDKGIISLEVGIPATVEFRPGYVAQNNVLEVTEEDKVEVSFRANYLQFAGGRPT